MSDVSICIVNAGTRVPMNSLPDRKILTYLTRNYAHAANTISRLKKLDSDGTLVSVLILIELNAFDQS